MEDSQVAGAVVLFAVLILVVGLVPLAPDMGRRTLLFGVEVDAHFRSSPAAQRILRRYRLFTAASGLSLLSIAALLTFVPGVRASHPEPILVACLLAAAADTFAFFLWGNRQVRALLRGTPAEARAEEAERHWKAGLFYFNPDDPRVQIEKRFGVGYTLNMARPVSWVIIGLPILFALLMVLVVGR